MLCDSSPPTPLSSYSHNKEQTFTSTLAELASTDNAELPPLRNPPMLEATEDLTNLSYLNEPAVLHSIRTRYQGRGQIYTYSGIVLVAVNPFAAVPLYESNLVQAYAGKRKGDVSGVCACLCSCSFRQLLG